MLLFGSMMISSFLIINCSMFLNAVSCRFILSLECFYVGYMLDASVVSTESNIVGFVGMFCIVISLKTPRYQASNMCNFTMQDLASTNQ